MSRPKRPRESSRRIPLALLAIAVLTIVDAGIIALAVNGSHASENFAAKNSVSAVEPESAVTPTSAAVVPSPTATVSTDSIGAGSPQTVIAPKRILAAFDSSTAWRAQTGSCPAALATPQLTTDSGATWLTTDVTGPTRVTALQRISVINKTSAMMIGLSQADCSVQLVKTFVSGKNYALYSKELDQSWFIDPATPARIHAPAAWHAAPCDRVITFAAKTLRSAAVLCADGTVSVTSDQAVSWSPSKPYPGANNIAASPGGYLITAGATAQCAGVPVLSLSNDAQSITSTGCLPLVAQPAAGQVAIASAASTVWIWAGDTVKRSTDGGATWN